MPISGAVYARIVSQYSDKGSKAAQKDIQKTAAKIDQFNKRVVKAYAAGAAAAAFFAYKVGKISVKAAIEDGKSQEALAIVLRSTTNATNAQIAATEEYISKQQLLTNVSDTELRNSLSTLVTATKDVTQAQYLNNLAVDVAVGANKDLSSVVNAFAKAAQGNLAPLKKLNIGIDNTTIAAKDFAGAFGQIEKTFGGAAETIAKKDPFTKLKLQFGEAAEALGVALLPALTDLANRISIEVVPAIEKFVAKNKELISQSLVDLVATIERIAIVGLKIIQFLSKFEALLTMFALLAPFGFLAAQLTLIFKAVSTGGKFFSNLYQALVKSVIPAIERFVVGAFRLAKVFVTGGLAAGFSTFIKLAVKAYKPLLALVLIISALAAGVIWLNKKFNSTEAVEKMTQKMEEQGRAALRATKTNKETAAQIKDRIAKEKEAAAALARSAAAQAKALEQQKKNAKFEADYAKLNKTLAKRAGVSLLSSEEEKMVQINAAIALQKRQKEIDAAEDERLRRLSREILLSKTRYDLAVRYQDILLALADTKIDTKEITVLALKWGVTTEAVEAYLTTLFAVEDGTISDDEIIKLAKSWGSTQAQAAQYLDFYQALNDGVLTSVEIEKLKSKWKLTTEQVMMYADFVGVVNDGKLEDAEIEKLKKNWKLTTDQVVDYILKIGSPVSYSGTLIDPARVAELAWLSAIKALERYLALLKAGTGQVVGAVTAPAPNTDGESAAAIAAAAVAAVQAAAAADDADKLAAEAAQAAADAAAEAAAAASKATEFTAKLTQEFPDLMAQVAKLEALQAAKELSGRSYVTDSEMDRILGGTRSDSAASIDERFRFKAFSPTMASASGGGFQNSMAGNVTVVVNVEGSVTAEQDLVTAVRNGLLGTQYNGSQITLQAV